MPEHTAQEEVWLEFQGASLRSEVYLNGMQLAAHECGFSTFRVQLTPYLREENELLVAVDNSVSDRIYPQTADFTFFGGIYRDVTLLVVPKIHFSLGNISVQAFAERNAKPEHEALLRECQETLQTIIKL